MHEPKIDRVLDLHHEDKLTDKELDEQVLNGCPILGADADRDKREDIELILKNAGADSGDSRFDLAYRLVQIGVSVPTARRLASNVFLSPRVRLPVQESHLLY